MKWLGGLIVLWWSASLSAQMPAHEEFSRKLAVSVGTQIAEYGFDLAGGTALEYKPNMGSLTVFSVNYAGLGALSWGLRQSVSASDRVKGDTRFDDWRFNFPYRQFNVFLFYSRFKGMYLGNSSTIDPSLPSSTPFIKFPELYSQNMGVNFTWVWNPERFSLAAVMDLTERQIKAGGSLLTGVTATETIFRNKGALIPSQVKASYNEDAEMYEGRVRALSMKVGYGYTDVYRRRWFISLLGAVAAGPQEVRISTPSEDYSILRLGLNFVELYAIAGYNGERFFTGLNFFTATATYQAKKAEISTRLVSGGLFIGTRF